MHYFVLKKKKSLPYTSINRLQKMSDIAGNKIINNLYTIKCLNK